MFLICFNTWDFFFLLHFLHVYCYCCVLFFPISCDSQAEQSTSRLTALKLISLENLNLAAKCWPWRHFWSSMYMIPYQQVTLPALNFPFPWCVPYMTKHSMILTVMCNKWAQIWKELGPLTEGTRFMLPVATRGFPAVTNPPRSPLAVGLGDVICSSCREWSLPL